MPTGDKAKGDIKRPTCPFCEGEWDSEHDKYEKNKCEKGECQKEEFCGWGNIGLGSYLGSYIAQARGKSNAQYKKDYVLAYKNGNIQAHHIICSEALNDDDGTWQRICFLTGYNVNCFRNGVNLPSLLKVACKAKVPLHKGNHDEGYGPGKNNSNYPNAVKRVISGVLQEYIEMDDPPACNKPEKMKQFVKDMNEKSQEIFDHIAKFEWTITWDGFDYQSANLIGCSNQTYIADKKGTGKDKLKDEKGNVLKNDNDNPIMVERSYTPEETDNQAILTQLREERISIEKIEKDRDERINEYFENISENNKSVHCNCGRNHPELNINLGEFTLQIGK